MGDDASQKKPVLILGGPTASGKSGLAISLAERLSGVIINADSMQVYRGLPVLTAQPTAEDKKKVPHRLYATHAPDESCSAASWRALALEEISNAQADNKFPIVVGGTGFYLKTLLQGISPVPDIPRGVRDEVSALQKKMGNPAFHRALSSRDPAMAAKLHPFNTQRLVRAWEVLEATGRSLAEFQALPPAPPPDDLAFLKVVLLPPRALLYEACNARFERMLEQGAVEEVERFRKLCPPDAAPARALGYPEISAWLDGKADRAGAVRAAQQSTRRYAKRQMTWFRHQMSADMTMDSPSLAAVLAYVERCLDSRPEA